MKRRSLLIGTAGLPLLPVASTLARTPCSPDKIAGDEPTCASTTTLPMGALSQDAVTPEQIALYLPITGNLSQEARAIVEYRLSGAGDYSLAAPLWRIQPQYSDVGVADAFAGTVFDLEPGNSYEIRVSVHEPGVGKDTKSANFSTRALPASAGQATNKVGSESELLAAIASAAPGDVIEFSGTINLSGRFDVASNSGTASNPIYLRGTDRDSSILSSPDAVMRILNTDYWILENCTLCGGGNDTGTNASNIGVNFWSEDVTGWTFRNLRIQGVDMGIMGNGQQNGMLIYDCILEGNNSWTRNNLESNATWNDDGIRIGGVGNAVWNNTVSDFGDALSYRRQNATHSVIGCFYYRNKVLRSGDDAIEAEYCQRNCGTYDNYTLNSNTMISIDGIFGGPYYHFRNRHINGGREIIKNGAQSTGTLFWNNTFVRTTGNTSAPGGVRMQYFSQSANVNGWEFINNLLLWEGDKEIWRFDEDAGGWQPFTCTNNAWGRNGQEIYYAGAGLPVGNLARVRAALSPIHDNDIDIKGQRAVFTNPVQFGSSYLTEITTEYDLTLKARAPVLGRGKFIPNISHNSDIGAVGFGFTPAVVGNRFSG